MLGEFFEYHTLNSILNAYNIKSSKLHKVLNSLSFNDITKIAAQLFGLSVKERLIELWQQSESQWSRANITFIIDSSIYKQWLSNSNSAFFDKYFSGQTGKAQYGFRLTVGGIAIEDTFYPLTFYISTKSHKDTLVAQFILHGMMDFVENIKNTNHLPDRQFYLSIDNGFNDNDLIEMSEQNNVIPICVPKKNQYFTFDEKEVKLGDFIENQFLKQEQEFYKTHPEDQDFYLRVKANYRCKNKDVILLIFRLNKSDKISVIYTTDMNIKAKTLRHRWFQRTYIEQYFRFSKHTLQFAQNNCRDENDFIKKISINFLKVNICLSVRNKVKKFKKYKHFTFGRIRLLTKTHRISEDMLLELLNA
jgi:hypothetical protein